MTMKFAAGVRGRRIIGTVATVAAAAAAVGLAVPAKASSAAPASRNLSGGQVAARSAVPWDKVGAGWALATYSAGHGGEGVKPTAGALTLYLVDPQGGRYKLSTWPASSPRSEWHLLGWSGDGRRALFVTSTSLGSTDRDHVYQLQLRTGRVTGFTLPGRVTAVGYTRPDGVNIVAEKWANSTGTGAITVERYSLTGKLQKNLVTIKDEDYPSVAYSSNGTELAAGIGNGLELVSNAGGVIRKLPVPNVTEGCTAVRWWNSGTVLASCMVTNEAGPRMWLVPASGAGPRALTPVRTGTNGDLGDFNAWQLSSGLYVDGYTGCGAVLIGRQPAHGKEQIVNMPGNPGSVLIVNATKSSLMVERINGCVPDISLVWFNPATRKLTVAIPDSHDQFGVTSVVPYFIAGKF